MQAVDQQVLDQVCQWLEADESCWLATVVETWGSSPRPVGSLLTCNSAGQVRGSLSGGCVEDDLAGEAHFPEDSPVSGRSSFQYGITPEETERLGLPCGGHLNIVVEPLARERLHSGVTSGICGNAFPGAVRFGEPSTCGTAPPMSKTSTRTRHCTTTTRRRFSPTPTVRSSSSSSSDPAWFSSYVAEMAQALDYQVTVCDPRAHLLDEFSVRGRHQGQRHAGRRHRKEHANDPLTAIVALTHDPRIDDMA